MLSYYVFGGPVIFCPKFFTLGTLLPVYPFIGRVVPRLLALNERVVLSGEWEQGFFSLTAVGAYNVGSICLHFDNVSIHKLLNSFN